jgi:hypothetical protein
VYDETGGFYALIALLTPMHLMTQAGGAIYVYGGTVVLNATMVSNSSAESGGLFYSIGGSVVFSDRTMLSNGTAEHGSSMRVDAGLISYILPAPAGRWLPNTNCEVPREACRYYHETVEQIGCEKHRKDCALAPDAMLDTAPWFCQPLTFVQPCDWLNSPRLLGVLVYQLACSSQRTRPWRHSGSLSTTGGTRSTRQNSITAASGPHASAARL